jgi:hypothetical protein
MALAGRDAQGFAIPGLGEGGELLGRQRVEGDLLVPGLGVGADHDLPVRDLGQDTEAEPERLLNQPPGTGEREGWPRSMAGTARSQKMPFTIGAACRSMPLATATLVRGPDGGPGRTCTSDFILIRGFPPGLVSPGWHRRPARTTDRRRPLGSDAVWTNGGPAPPARGGSGAPRRGPCRGKVDPRRLPPTSEPRLGDRLVRGSPGGVWARDIPLYRRAVPGHRHGDTPARWVCKPHGRSSGDERRLGLPALAGG